MQGPARQRVLPPDHRGGLQGRREVRQGGRLGHHQARLSQVPKQVSTEMENKKKLFLREKQGRTQKTNLWRAQCYKYLGFFDCRMKVPFLKKSFKYLGNFGEGLRLKKDNLSR